MRRLLLLWLLTCAAICRAYFSTVVFEYQGIVYRVAFNRMNASTGTDTPYYAEALSNDNKYSGNLVIPETITCDLYKDGVLVPTNVVVTNIDAFAFSNCNELISISIPKSVRNIGTLYDSQGGNDSGFLSNEFCSFENCANLSNISIDPENGTYEIQGNCIVNKNEKRMIAVFGGNTIPPEVDVIGKYGYWGQVLILPVLF